MPLDPRRPTSRNKSSTQRSPLDNLRKPNANIPKLSGGPATHRSTARPTTSKIVRPSTTRGVRSQQGGDEEGDFVPPPPKKNNTPIIIGACVGGLVLLVIIIAAASGGGKGNYPQRRQYNENPDPVVNIPQEEPRKEVLKFGGQRFADSGAICFVCANSGKHEDKEVEINFCPNPNCQKKNQFCVTENTFKCFNCEQEFPKDKIVCPECGRPPTRPARIKHK
jgi:hypothetical protein